MPGVDHAALQCTSTRIVHSVEVWLAPITGKKSLRGSGLTVLQNCIIIAIVIDAMITRVELVDSQMAVTRLCRRSLFVYIP